MNTEHEGLLDSPKNIYSFFLISILLKGAVSAIEILAGIATLLIPVGAIAPVVTFLTESELAENPNDFIAMHLVQLAQSFSASTQLFVATYLLSRGVVKLFLVVALLNNKLWAYPLSLATLGAFVLYQIYQIVTTHSLIVLGLTLFDFVVIYFIWKEYTLVRVHK